MPHIDLLELPYFEGIEITDMVSLIDAMRPRQFAAGSRLITEGDPIPPPLYIITKGLIDIVRKIPNKPDDPPYLLAQQSGPTLVGELELFCPNPAANTVMAITQVSTFVLERETFASLMAAKHPALMPFIFHVAQVACERLHATDKLFVRLAAANKGTGLAPRPTHPLKPKTK